MNRELFIELVSKQLKMIRTEQGYSQDKMADVLGISKKTLVQIEKGRVHASWTVVVAACAIFRDSDTLQAVLGNEPLETVALILNKHIRPVGLPTMGGRIWWRDIKKDGMYKLQQNVVSQHYRILNHADRRVYSTFDKEDVFQEWTQLLDAERSDDAQGRNQP